MLYIFKGYILPYPPGSLGPEVSGMIWFILVQFIRVEIGNWYFLLIYLNIVIASVGNKQETTAFLFYSLFLAFPVIVGYTYFLQLQTYSLIFDFILNAIGIIFTLLEMVTTIYAVLYIKSNDKNT